MAGATTTTTSAKVEKNIATQFLANPEKYNVAEERAKLSALISRAQATCPALKGSKEQKLEAMNASTDFIQILSNPEAKFQKSASNKPYQVGKRAIEALNAIGAIEDVEKDMRANSMPYESKDASLSRVVPSALIEALIK